MLKSRRAQLEAGMLTRPTHPCTKPYITRTHESLVTYAPTSSTCPMLLQATQNVKTQINANGYPGAVDEWHARDDADGAAHGDRECVVAEGFTHWRRVAARWSSPRAARALLA